MAAVAVGAAAMLGGADGFAVFAVAVARIIGDRRARVGQGGPGHAGTDGRRNGKRRDQRSFFHAEHSR